MPDHRRRDHLQDAGWNGIYTDKVMHSCVRDVDINNADNAVIMAYTNHLTLTGITIAGGAGHHGISMREDSHDNLVTGFAVRAMIRHGISVQDLCSGNVFASGIMEHGTFDSHRGAPFDNVRTDITLLNDCNPGGSSDAGPYQGRRMVNWNIRLTGNRRNWVAAPSLFPMCALVGIQGGKPQPLAEASASAATRATAKIKKPRTHEPNFMPVGDLGTIVVDDDREPQPQNLYQAQVELRLGRPVAVAPPAQ